MWTRKFILYFIRTASLAMSVTLPSFSATADEPLLVALERHTLQSSNTFKSQILQVIRAIKDSSNASNPFYKYQLISNLSDSIEKDVVKDELGALRSIEFVIQLYAEWKTELKQWESSALQDQGEALLVRWFVKKDSTDLQLASQSFEDAEKLQFDPKRQGSSLYQHAAAYEFLAEIAKSKGRPREEQIELIQRGIAISKSAQLTYPNYHYAIGLDALYGQFAFVSERSASGDFIDEWIAFVSERPEDKGYASAASIANELFALGRDAEANAWIEKYYVWRASKVKNMEAIIRLRVINDACTFGFHSHGFSAYGERNPSGLQALNKKYCEVLRAAAQTP
jgi:hypothetical protein